MKFIFGLILAIALWGNQMSMAQELGFFSLMDTTDDGIQLGCWGYPGNLVHYVIDSRGFRRVFTNPNEIPGSTPVEIFKNGKMKMASFRPLGEFPGFEYFPDPCFF